MSCLCFFSPRRRKTITNSRIDDSTDARSNTFVSVDSTSMMAFHLRLLCCHFILRFFVLGIFLVFGQRMGRRRLRVVPGASHSEISRWPPRISRWRIWLARGVSERSSKAGSILARQVLYWKDYFFSVQSVNQQLVFDEQVVAIKQLNQYGLQGSKEFLVEVLMLIVLRHENLVSLIGYCAEGDERLLVYEYMPQGSLEKHLFGRISYLKALHLFSASPFMDFPLC